MGSFTTMGLREHLVPPYNTYQGSFGTGFVQYFEATQVGQKRSDDAEKLLSKYAGFARAAIFLKTRTEGFEPVGEENLYAVVEINPGTVMIAIVDGEGNTKAMSSYVGKVRSKQITKQIELDGIKRYDGKVNLPV
jgi:hypothetical protein